MAVTIRHGVNTISVDSAAGKTVGEVRAQVADILNVPENAQARVSGVQAEDSKELADGDTLEFVKTAGEKGAVAAA